MKRLRALPIVTALTLASSPAALRAGDIVDIAIGAGQFKTLAAALDAADLVSTLRGPGPFTVFAPTDEAFAALPGGTVEKLLEPGSRKALTTILTYHVVAGRVMASDLVGQTGADTVSGQRVAVDAMSSGIQVGKARVVASDIRCDNGVIHVIDSVLLPSQDDIAAVAAKAGSFGTLLAAVKAAGLVDTLSGDGPFTVFAPTDEAFAKLPEGTVASLLEPANRDQLVKILTYHVVPGRVRFADAVKAGRAKTVQGQRISLAYDAEGLRVNDAKVVATDIEASNGTIHVIDSVILPPRMTASDAMRLIETTVAKGSRMYNSGDHRGCADLYMSAMLELAETEDDVLSHSMRRTVQHVLHRARRTHHDGSRAWVLRHGMDRAYASLRRMEMSPVASSSL